MKKHLIELSFHDYEEFKLVRPLIKCFLQKNLFGQYHMMEVAVNEAVNNALRFGQQKSCAVSMTVLRKKILIVRVKHQGVGFVVKTMLEQIDTRKHLEDELWREGGRGLLIIKAAADCVHYNKKGTEILMAKILTEPCLSIVSDQVN